jgi:hypothetical protein
MEIHRSGFGRLDDGGGSRDQREDHGPGRFVSEADRTMGAPGATKIDGGAAAPGARLIDRDNLFAEASHGRCVAAAG